MVYMCHIFFIQCIVDEHLGWFQVFAIVNSATMNIHVHMSCWWEYKLVKPLWKTVWQFLKDLELEIPYDPAIPLLVYTQRIINIHISLFAVPIYHSKDLKPIQMPINDRLDKENVAYIHHGILCCYKKG